MSMRAIESRPSLQYPKDARAITQVHTFIFDVQHTDISKSQLNTPESQLHSLAKTRKRKVARPGGT